MVGGLDICPPETSHEAVARLADLEEEREIQAPLKRDHGGRAAEYPVPSSNITPGEDNDEQVELCAVEGAADKMKTDKVIRHTSACESLPKTPRQTVRECGAKNGAKSSIEVHRSVWHLMQCELYSPRYMGPVVGHGVKITCSKDENWHFDSAPENQTSG